MDDLPPFPWRLSAPETLALLWGPETGDAWALKVAMLELVARRVLMLAETTRPRLFRSSETVNVLRAGAHGLPPDGPFPAIAQAHAMLSATGKHPNGVPVTMVATDVFTRRYRRVRTGFLRNRWDRTGGGYVQSEVLPLLARLGYFTPEESTRMGLFTTRRWSLTAAGAAALAEAQRFMAIGRDSFPDWVEREPELAAAYVERAGPSILLLGGTASLVRRLHERTQTQPSGGSAVVAALVGAFGPGPRDDLDAAFFALSADVDRAWSGLLQSGGFVVFIGE